MNKNICINIQWIISVIIIIILSLLCYFFRGAFIYHQNTFAIAANIFTILAIIGVVMALIEYYGRRYQAKKQTLIALKSQLDVIGTWSNYGGTGYHEWEKEKLIKDNILSWGNPFHQVFPTEYTALQTIFSLPGIVYLPDIIIKKIAPLNQEITSFLSYLEIINAFRFSEGSKFIVNIFDKLNKYNKEKFTPEEDRFRKKLTEMYGNLHVDFIGDDFNMRLHFKHKELLDLVKKELSKL